MQRLPTWSLFLITNMPKFEAIIQKSATRRRKLFNGRMECTYYQFLGPRPPRGYQPDENTSSVKPLENDSELIANPVTSTPTQTSSQTLTSASGHHDQQQTIPCPPPIRPLNCHRCHFQLKRNWSPHKLPLLVTIRERRIRRFSRYSEDYTPKTGNRRSCWRVG